MKDWYGEEEKKDNIVKAEKESVVPDKNSWIIAGAVLLGSLIVSGAIFFSRGASLKNSDATAIQPRDNQPTGPVKVSVDDDPVLGDKNAPLTLIEFSDYECPFCKKSFEQVLPELKKNYIDTGKVKFVYRDFPLSFHANAQKEAEAAECARAQSNDTMYFKFHDQIFTQTTAGGTGLALTELPVIAKNLGLNVNQFQQCLDSGKFKDEVAKDMADGTKAGVSGTPSWFIGTSTKDGMIDGTFIVGAQPFSAFKTIIDEKLRNGQ
jgi:protein-disulfide isomerase